MKKNFARYYQALGFLESLKNIPTPPKVKKLGDGAEQRKIHSARLNFLLDLLGRPEKGLRYIHITGTSGKGSVTTFIQSILSEAGFKTGGFLSPHITTELERIKINDQFIAPEEFAALVDYLKPHLMRCALEAPYGVPSFFEIILAMAFLYFKKEKCQYVVLEAGAGGEWDPTNVILKTEAAVITNVGLDHTNILGKTKTAIARDKAGIIKKGTKFFTAEQSPAILKIFQEFCQKRQAAFFKKIDFKFKILQDDLSGLKFEYGGHKFQTHLVGAHQARNIILALEAVKDILKGDYRLMKKGIARVRMPARLEIMQKNPLVILDGAHNFDKMGTTTDFALGQRHRKILLITALAGNKDFNGIFKKIIPCADRIFLTRFLSYKRRSAELKKIFAAAKKFSRKKISLHIDPFEALEAALKEAGKDDLILVTGSFFLTGELRKRWFSEEDILEKRKMI